MPILLKTSARPVWAGKGPREIPLIFTWVVELQRDGRKLKTYLENTDTDSCLLKENCIGLGIEIAQLQSNIDRLTA
jgi:hypothetical protein